MAATIVQFASALWSGMALVLAGLAVLLGRKLSRFALSSAVECADLEQMRARGPGSLCSWQEVASGLERESRRARRLRLAYLVLALIRRRVPRHRRSRSPSEKPNAEGE